MFFVHKQGPPLPMGSQHHSLWDPNATPYGIPTSTLMGSQHHSPWDPHTNPSGIPPPLPNGIPTPLPIPILIHQKIPALAVHINDITAPVPRRGPTHWGPQLTSPLLHHDGVAEGQQPQELPQHRIAVPVGRFPEPHVVGIQRLLPMATPGQHQPLQEAWASCRT